MRAANLRCFVAMAFGRPDTDAVYAAIKRTLKPLGIVTTRVDRIEHNENIDAKIISEIEGADLVIADLTYARPSVYFEAGYAERQGAVVYTVRRDHFRSRDEDTNGNLQVHFDLKMRNIVAWSSPKDASFLARLRRRVSKVIVPIVRAKASDSERRRVVTEFDNLSLQQKRDQLLDTAQAHFNSLGHEIKDLRRVHGDEPHPSIRRVQSEIGISFSAIKQTRDTFRFVFVHVTPSVTVKLSKHTGCHSSCSHSTGSMSFDHRTVSPA